MAGPSGSLRVYYGVFTTLLVLTTVTVYVAFFDLGFLNNVVAMTIAVTKAVLVILYFMHLRSSPRLTWLWAAAGFAWLVILLALTVSDYVSRGW